jgi:hypothetical protein
MTTTSQEPEEPRALTVLTELYLENLEAPTPTEIDREFDVFLARVTSAKARRRGLVRWSLAGATAVLCTLVVVRVASVHQRRSPTPDQSTLTYQIEGGAVLEGGYLRESGHAGMKVLFNEGSTFALTAGARGQIRSVDKEGAHVAIERGAASFQVTRSSGRRWLVDVGPFLVTVKGTVFGVSWDPLSEQFDLSLRQGSVVVSGPISAGEIALRAGQHLAVNLARTETVITEDDAEHEDAVVGAAAPRAMPAPNLQPAGGSNKPNGPGLAGAPASIAKTWGERRWSDELARGHWDRILDDVQRIGVDASLSRAPSEDLFALAYAARYRRNPDLARAALLAARRRFPDSPRAPEAIFLLGRVEESREGGTAQAISRYDEYLARAPAGSFVGEALGRKMTLVDKFKGPARARPVAEEYLRRFPEGSYAGLARALMRVP